VQQLNRPQQGPPTAHLPISFLPSGSFAASSSVGCTNVSSAGSTGVGWGQPHCSRTSRSRDHHHLSWQQLHNSIQSSLVCAFVISSCRHQRCTSASPTCPSAAPHKKYIAIDLQNDPSQRAPHQNLSINHECRHKSGGTMQCTGLGNYA
jgi:hypothetical protein